MLSGRFGIEFAPEVVKADGNVHNLARRICNAKRVLVCSRLSSSDLITICFQPLKLTLNITSYRLPIV